MNAGRMKMIFSIKGIVACQAAPQISKAFFSLLTQALPCGLAMLREGTRNLFVQVDQ
jgi:hypothetical protein